MASKTMAKAEAKDAAFSEHATPAEGKRSDAMAFKRERDHAAIAPIWA